MSKFPPYIQPSKHDVRLDTAALKEVIKETNPPEGRQPISNEKTMASKGRLVKITDIMRKIGFSK